MPTYYWGKHNREWHLVAPQHWTEALCGAQIADIRGKIPPRKEHTGLGTPDGQLCEQCVNRWLDTVPEAVSTIATIV